MNDASIFSSSFLQPGAGPLQALAIVHSITEGPIPATIGAAVAERVSRALLWTLEILSDADRPVLAPPSPEGGPPPQDPLVAFCKAVNDLVIGRKILILHTVG